MILGKERSPRKKRNALEVFLGVRSLVTLHRHQEKALIHQRNQGVVGIGL